MTERERIVAALTVKRNKAIDQLDKLYDIRERGYKVTYADIAAAQNSIDAWNDAIKLVQEISD